jgi:hypothetical protein
MKHRVRHDLGQAESKKVAEAALKSYSERFAQYSPSYRWVTDHRANLGFSAKGISLSGSLEILVDGFDLDLEVPFLLRPFKGKAIGVIEEEIRHWVQKSKVGEI